MLCSHNIAADATYFPGRAASIHYRPRPSTSAVTSDVLHAPATTGPSADQPSQSAALADEKPLGPLHNIAETLKSALPDALKHAGHAAAQTVKTAVGGDIEIGSLGILHPEVLDKFSIVNPCSALEIDVEAFL